MSRHEGSEHCPALSNFPDWFSREPIIAVHRDRYVQLLRLRVGWWGRRLVSRRQHIGLVFQTFHLIPELNAEDNVLLPAWLGSFRASPALERRAREILERLGVPENRGAVRRQSRGEQQRVALARALLFDPAVILADEPTASLDARAGETVIRMLSDMAREDGRTVIGVSHDPALIEQADMLITLERGRLAGNSREDSAA